MKRSRDNSQDMNNTSSPSGQPARIISSCTRCRKAKTRCEILASTPGDAPVQCHRCKNIKAHCSYSDMDQSQFRENYKQRRKYATPPQESPSRVGSEVLRSLSPSTTVQSLQSEQLSDTSRRHPPWLWSFIDRYNTYDWLDQPLTAIEDLSWRSAEVVKHTSPTQHPLSDSPSEDGLTPDQRQSLLNKSVRLDNRWCIQIS
jgi:hypothetical protein